MEKENINDRSTFKGQTFRGVWGCSKHFGHNNSNLQFRDGLSFQYLFISTFYLFFLIPCTPQNMCNAGGWFFRGEGWVLLIGMVCILLHFGGFFTVVWCLYFLSLVYPTVIPCTKQSNIDLDEYLGCSWITRNQLLSEKNLVEKQIKPYGGKHSLLNSCLMS